MSEFALFTSHSARAGRSDTQPILPRSGHAAAALVWAPPETGKVGLEIRALAVAAAAPVGAQRPRTIFAFQTRKVQAARSLACAAAPLGATLAHVLAPLDASEIRQPGDSGNEIENALWRTKAITRLTLTMCTLSGW